MTHFHFLFVWQTHVGNRGGYHGLWNGQDVSGIQGDVENTYVCLLKSEGYSWKVSKILGGSPFQSSNPLDLRGNHLRAVTCRMITRGSVSTGKNQMLTDVAPKDPIMVEGQGPSARCFLSPTVAKVDPRPLASPPNTTGQTHLWKWFLIAVIVNINLLENSIALAPRTGPLKDHLSDKCYVFWLVFNPQPVAH